ncbi:type IV toxin-antitoxin system AbiEi family antitoxin domain-containing protein [Cumulibacter soli]|uniref:type IV toxin-antitoxin system AbiEi family antitoxin domain-containing protein n=1 Tax=Cumulibacter soli TaxID=2546344 RepID=UPI001068A41E|nr:type IV toxin-antitoxin system AbiEi family antitoxin domain-containing protein [Cumulibacter soli]
MHARTTLPANLVRLAEHRQGVLTRAELIGAGLGSNVIARMVRDWQVLARGVYVVPGDHDRWLQRVFAGIALGGAGAAVSGRTAVALWGLGERPSVIEVLSSKRRPASAPWLRWRRDDLDLRRVVSLEPARVCLEDAVVDAAADGSRSDALALVSLALQERRTTPQRLYDALHRRARVRHRALLLSAIGDSAAGAHSAFEHLYLATVERAHGLPPMQRQYTVPASQHDADGAYERYGLLIELDGVRYHDRAADEALDVLHATHGFNTTRLSWGRVDSDPCAVARMVAAVIGYDRLRRCRRCP